MTEGEPAGSVSVVTTVITGTTDTPHVELAPYVPAKIEREDYIGDWNAHPEFHGVMFRPRDPGHGTLAFDFSFTLLQIAGGFDALIRGWRPECACWGSHMALTRHTTTRCYNDKIEVASKNETAGPDATSLRIRMGYEAMAKEAWERAMAVAALGDGAHDATITGTTDTPHVELAPYVPAKVFGPDESEAFYGRGISRLLDPKCCCSDDEPGHLDSRCPLFSAPLATFCAGIACRCLRENCQECGPKLAAERTLGNRDLIQVSHDDIHWQTIDRTVPVGVSTVDALVALKQELGFKYIRIYFAPSHREHLE